ncbi:MAG: M48 family metallopeptidase [Pseudomonadota bacterium]
MKSTTTNTRQNINLASRSRLLLLMWCGFWLLLTILMLGLLWLPFTQLHNRSVMAFSGLAATLAALVLAYAVRPRGWAKTKTISKDAPAITGEFSPALHKILQQLAKNLGIVAPTTVKLTDCNKVCIDVTRHWNGKIKSLQVGIGLPLFRTLSEAELGSVIVHEYAQFFAGRTPLGPWIYRTRLLLINATTALDSSLFLPEIIFRSFARLFLKLSQGVSREQEFAADALAAQIFGVIAARAAIEKIHLISPMWSVYLDHELNPAIKRGARLPIFDGFKRFCKPSAKRAEVQAAIQYAANRSIAEFDSQPPLAERVSRMTPGAKPAYPPLADCLHLLGGEIAAENLWYAKFSQQKLCSSSWDNFGVQILQPQIQRTYADGWMNPEKLALSELPGMVRETDDLWNKIRPDDVNFLSPQGKLNYVLAALEEWTMASLIQRGFTAKVSPGLAVSMERGEQVVQAAELINAALNGTLKSASLKQYDRPVVAN